jgi:hypothetical protein
VNLGHRLSSLFGEKFLSAPIHSPPLSGRLIGPSETTLHTRRLRKISSEHLTLGNGHANKVPSRIQNLRTTRSKQHLQTLIQQLGHRKQIEPQQLNKNNMPEVTLSLTLISPSESTRPRPLSPKVMYVLDTTKTRLENHPLSPVICLEQPESINQTFLKSPT